ncbi:transcriptional regulator [Histophilus somni]|uniref:Transcriptional regulator n=1 Tax=Histophilus somni TaxID=731 RepID=A0AAX2S4M3_HISSO|nr:Mor transcription activator family protein [Histophilus somni]TEW31412.1 transcriptional regulator [Histophilus somni]THA97460.1 transcriptional regulator [Histophilus somni]
MIVNTANQADLFAEDSQFVGALFDALDHIPDIEIKNRWPTTLANIIDVMRTELVRQGLAQDSANKQASKLVGVIAHYFGGQSIYLPTGDKLKEALRNTAIYQDFTGNNVPELVRKYQLSESHIYAIIREQRALYRRRNQPELCFD